MRSGVWRVAESKDESIRAVVIKLRDIFTSFKPMDARTNALRDRHATMMQGRK